MRSLPAPSSLWQAGSGREVHLVDSNREQRFVMHYLHKRLSGIKDIVIKLFLYFCQTIIVALDETQASFCLCLPLSCSHPRSLHSKYSVAVLALHPIVLLAIVTSVLPPLCSLSSSVSRSGAQTGRSLYGRRAAHRDVYHSRLSRSWEHWRSHAHPAWRAVPQGCCQVLISSSILP